MQRGLRFNKTSQELWHAYFRLELMCLRKAGAVGATDDAAAAGDADGDGDGGDSNARASKRAKVDADGGAAPALSEADFRSGAVALIVLRHALAAVPRDVTFSLHFVELCDDLWPQLSAAVLAAVLPSLNQVCTASCCCIASLSRRCPLSSSNAVVAVGAVVHRCSWLPAGTAWRVGAWTRRWAAVPRHRRILRPS
jgi:hypothetical protein